MAAIKTDAKTLDDFLVSISNLDVVILLQNFDNFLERDGVIRVYEFFWRVIRETKYLKIIVAGGLDTGSTVT
jgi:hypothetical protein